MAKNNEENYLKSIFNLLDSIITENKKANKNAGTSNVPNTSMLTVDANSIKTLGDSLKVLSSAIAPLTKISKNEFEAVADGIKLLGEAISSFKLDKESLASINNMLNAFIQIHQTITQLTDNFAKSILKLNPIKGRLLGWALGGFYGNVLKGMRAGFVKNLVGIFKKVPSSKEDPDFKSRTINFGLMIAELLLINKEKIMQLWFMGVMLGPRIGKAIGGFFKNLINELAGGPGGSAKAQAAAKVAFSVATLIGTLTLSLIALVILFKTNSIEDIIGGGLMLVGIVALSISIIKKLSSPNFKRNSKDAIVGTTDILMLIGGLTLSLIALTLLAKNAAWPEIGKAATMLIGVVGLALGIILALGSDAFKRNANQAIVGTTDILLLIGGLTLSLIALIFVAKNTEWEEIGKGATMLIGLVGLSIGIIWILSRPSFQTNAKQGLLGVGSVVLLVAGLSIAMILFGKYLKQINDISQEAAWRGMAITGIMVGGVIAIAATISAVMSSGVGAAILLAGVAGVELIAIMIASISGAMLLFTTMLEKVKDLKQSDINDAVNKILGTSFGVKISDDKLPEDNASLIGALGAIINGMVGFGVKAAVKAGIIGISIQPVISAISNFVDVVQKMASLKIADEWDPKTGRPTHYIELTHDAFSTAAKNLTGAFKLFLENLSAGISGVDKNSIKIIRKLFPGKSLFGREKAGIGTVINAVSQFVDVVQRMASKTIPNAWDSNGNPTSYKTLNDEDFTNAAINISVCFGLFLRTLSEELGKLDRKQVRSIKKISKSLGKLLPELTGFLHPLMQIAAGKMQVGDQVVDIDSTKLQPAVINIVSAISELFKLNELANQDNSHRKIKKMFKTFKKSLKHLSEAIQFITNSGLKIDSSLEKTFGYITSAIGKITSFFAPDYSELASNARKFKKIMRRFSKGMSWIFSDTFNISSVPENFDQNLINIIGDANNKNGLYRIIDFFNNSNFAKIALKSIAFKKMIKSFGKGLSYLYSDSFKLSDLSMNFVQNVKDIIGENTETNKTGLYQIIEFANSLNLKTAEKLFLFDNSMKHVSNGLHHLKPYLNATPKEIVDLANAFKQLDAELIEKEEKRTKAVQSVSSNFKDMAENIQKLNDTLAQSMQLTNRYNGMRLLTGNMLQQRGAEAIVAATEHVKDTVQNAVENTKHLADIGNNDKQKENMTQFAQIVSQATAQAVAVALNNWSSQNKELIVKFDESPKTIFGNVEMG